MITRSKARSRQSLGSVASPRARPPRRTSTQKRTAQQSSEGVIDGAKAVGGRRPSLAGGRKRSTGQAVVVILPIARLVLIYSIVWIFHRTLLAESFLLLTFIFMKFIVNCKILFIC